MSSANAMSAKVSIRALTCALLMLVCACSSPEVEAPMDESISSDPPFILMDAYRGNEQYFLRYRRGQNIYYAVGDLAAQISYRLRGQAKSN